MGCCLSKDNGFSNTPPPPFPPPTHFQVPESDPHPAKAPLSPVFEEESVKEVLSEIPKLKPKPVPEEPKQSTLLQEAKKDEDNKKPPCVPKVEEEQKKERKVEVGSPEISEVSEICSLSESISTTTLTERKEDEDGEVVQQRVHRSPAKSLRKRSIPGDFMGSKSPARRLNPSPGRRNDNEVSHMTHTAARRRMSSTSSENNNNRSKRDPNERSARRSRSPATRVNSGGNRSGPSGRSPSRKAPPPPPPRSPARIKPPPPPAAAGKERKEVEEEEEEEEEEETKEGNGTTNESIENPLVSLECFIFL